MCLRITGVSLVVKPHVLMNNLSPAPSSISWEISGISSQASASPYPHSPCATDPGPLPAPPPHRLRGRPTDLEGVIQQNIIPAVDGDVEAPSLAERLSHQSQVLATVVLLAGAEEGQVEVAHVVEDGAAATVASGQRHPGGVQMVGVHLAPRVLMPPDDDAGCVPPHEQHVVAAEAEVAVEPVLEGQVSEHVVGLGEEHGQSLGLWWRRLGGGRGEGAPAEPAQGQAERGADGQLQRHGGEGRQRTRRDAEDAEDAEDTGRTGVGRGQLGAAGSGAKRTATGVRTDYLGLPKRKQTKIDSGGVAQWCNPSKDM